MTSEDDAVGEDLDGAVEPFLEFLQDHVAVELEAGVLRAALLRLLTRLAGVEAELAVLGVAVEHLAVLLATEWVAEAEVLERVAQQLPDAILRLCQPRDNHVEDLDVVDLALIQARHGLMEVGVDLYLRLSDERERIDELTAVDHLVDLLEQLRAVLANHVLHDQLNLSHALLLSRRMLTRRICPAISSLNCCSRSRCRPVASLTSRTPARTFVILFMPASNLWLYSWQRCFSVLASSWFSW